MFVMIMVSICRHTSSINNSKDEKSKRALQLTKKNLPAALTLAIVFGLGWAFGLTATSLPVKEITLTFQIIFCILVGAQGVLIFILHGLKNKEFRGFWKQIIHLIAHKSRLSYRNIVSFTKSTAASESAHQSSTGATVLATLSGHCHEKSHTSASSSVACSTIAGEKSCYLDDTKPDGDNGNNDTDRYVFSDQLKA